MKLVVLPAIATILCFLGVECITSVTNSAPDARELPSGLVQGRRKNVTDIPSSKEPPSDVQALSIERKSIVKNDDNIHSITLYRKRNGAVVKAIRNLFYMAQILSLTWCMRSSRDAQEKAMDAIVKKTIEEGIVPTDDVLEEQATQLPHGFTPELGPLMALVVTTIASVLFHLVQHWSIGAKCWLNYRRVGDPTMADVALVSKKLFLLCTIRNY